MYKEKIATFGVILFFVIGLVFLFSDKTYDNKYCIEKVRIDSVSYRDRYTFLPDKIWIYYTKHGVITSTSEKYSVGDSIEIKTLKVKVEK
jgi:hypothetical protein